ncbi:hypothetical protein N0V88_004321 [Collariella sp. IMI 366227]|nr:hypothetical protein N0V88_004321 [Collariella sp. IMI 366227]
MARIACEAFDDEQALANFDKSHEEAMPDMAELQALSQRREAEVAWRRDNMERRRRLLGRHFIVATCLKNPDDYLKKPQVALNGAYPREEILGWAEWQDPMPQVQPLARESENDGQGDKAAAQPFMFNDDFEQTLSSLTLYHNRQPFFVPPHSAMVPLAAALKSFQRAAAKQHEDWKQWHKYYFPTCFGFNGDIQGQRLVLRSLVVKTPFWGDGVDNQLLEWGTRRAANRGWEILAAASTSSIVSTLNAFSELDFGELCPVDILGDTQLALVWEPGQEVENGELEQEEEQVVAKPTTMAIKDARAAVQRDSTLQESASGMGL